LDAIRNPMLNPKGGRSVLAFFGVISMFEKRVGNRGLRKPKQPISENIDYIKGGYRQKEQLEFKA
jgi:hypothetical protein